MSDVKRIFSLVFRWIFEMILSMRSIVAICHYQDFLSKMKSRNRSLLGFMKHGPLLFRHGMVTLPPPTSCIRISIARAQNSRWYPILMLKFLHPESHPQKQNLKTSKTLGFVILGSPAVSPSSSCASPTSMIDRSMTGLSLVNLQISSDRITISSSYLHQSLSLQVIVSTSTKLTNLYRRGDSLKHDQMMMMMMMMMMRRRRRIRRRRRRGGLSLDVFVLPMEKEFGPPRKKKCMTESKKIRANLMCPIPKITSIHHWSWGWIWVFHTNCITLLTSCWFQWPVCLSRTNLSVHWNPSCVKPWVNYTIAQTAGGFTKSGEFPSKDASRKICFSVFQGLL